MKEKLNSAKPNRGSLVFLIIYILLVILLSFLALKGATAFGYRFLTFREAIKGGIEFKGGSGFNVHVSGVKPQTDTSDNSTNASDSTDTTQNTTQTVETKANSNDFNKAIDIISKRLKRINVNTNVMAVGDSDIRVETGNTVNVNTCRLLSTVGLIEFKDVPEDTSTTPAKVILNSDDIKSCGALYNQQSRSYTLQFTFKDKAKLKTVTTENLDKKLNILLDNNQIVETTISSVVDNGVLNVTEFTNINQIELLSIMINDGKLPVSTDISGVFSLNASFGANIGSKIIIATLCILALLAIVLFLLYRVSGIMTFISIASWGLIWSIVFINLGETLNIVVLIGMICSFFVAIITSLYILNNLKIICIDDKKIINFIDITYSNTSKQIIFANVGIIILGVIVFLLGGASFEGLALSIMLGSTCTLISIMIITRILLKLCVNSGIAKQSEMFIGAKGGMKLE